MSHHEIIHSLLLRIKGSIQDLVQRPNSLNEHVDTYKDLLLKYETLADNRYSIRGKSSLKGYCYLHCINNFAKMTAVFKASGNTISLYQSSGEKDLVGICSEYMSEKRDQIRKEQVVDAALHKHKDATIILHYYAFDIRDDCFIIAALSSSNHFQPPLFWRFCIVIRELFLHVHEKNCPYLADYHDELQKDIAAFIQNGTGEKDIHLIVYKITRYNEMYDHLNAIELMQIHEYIMKKIMELYPQDSKVYSLSPSLYAVFIYADSHGLAENAGSLDLIFNGNNIPYSRKSHHIGDILELKKLIWEMQKDEV